MSVTVNVKAVTVMRKKTNMIIMSVTSVRIFAVVII